MLACYRYHMSKQDSEAVLACCRRGQEESSLWVQALWSCVRDTREQPKELFHEVICKLNYSLHHLIKCFLDFERNSK